MKIVGPDDPRMKAARDVMLNMPCASFLTIEQVNNIAMGFAFALLDANSPLVQSVK